MDGYRRIYSCYHQLKAISRSRDNEMDTYHNIAGPRSTSLFRQISHARSQSSTHLINHYIVYLCGDLTGK